MSRGTHQQPPPGATAPTGPSSSGSRYLFIATEPQLTSPTAATTGAAVSLLHAVLRRAAPRPLEQKESSGRLDRAPQLTTPTPFRTLDGPTNGPASATPNTSGKCLSALIG
ncbi:hypothetical protein NDU88_005059 [Pleurodeles waltl]|uniref:Uncharacterized protein n=1 Tax=Pleurodeles waltl TaxID=8319 RepID=A0AAV7SKM4_PLEWA|nr:hypothetical protein NDU88_005059 [Pleurodeles waltl]